jgi:hypothetical protein
MAVSSENWLGVDTGKGGWQGYLARRHGFLRKLWKTRAMANGATLSQGFPWGRVAKIAIFQSFPSICWLGAIAPRHLEIGKL